MADKVRLASFELKDVSVASMRGDEMKSVESMESHVGGQGQIKQVAPNNKSASSPVRRQPNEGTPANSSKIIISPVRRNQSGVKQSAHVKSPRQRARRSTTSAATFKSRLKSSAPSKSPLSQPRKPMARCNGTKICSGCHKPIRDQFLLGACDKYWHEDCLKCDRCHAKLGELGSTLYERANMNLCRQDYLEMFGQKAICAVCDKLIYASEMVMRARDNVYHLECFACQLCGLRFCIGDRFHLCENKIVCQYDYDEHICPLQATMLLDYPINCQQLPAGPPTSTTGGPMSVYQQSEPASEQLGGYMSMLSSNSQTMGVNQSELAPCGYSQSMLLGSNQIATATTASTLEQASNDIGILAMPMNDAEDQETGGGGGERVELTMLGGCGPMGKSNESQAGPTRAESVAHGRDESKLVSGDGSQTSRNHRSHFMHPDTLDNHFDNDNNENVGALVSWRWQCAMVLVISIIVVGVSTVRAGR